MTKEQQRDLDVARLTKFFDGFLVPQQNIDEETFDESTNTVLYRMFREHSMEKLAIAEIYYEEVVKNARDIGAASTTNDDARQWWAQFWNSRAAPHAAGPSPKYHRAAPSVFVESGSTLLYVSKALRPMLDDATREGLPVSVRTNNHLTAALFLQERERHQKQLATMPFLFSGYLEGKYHGIFPFYSKNDRPDREHDPRLWDIKQEEERSAYAQCRLDLATCDILLLAASRLSLRFGPLVGSRENAIFKNACYNACVPPLGTPSNHRHELHLFISAQKLVGHSEENLLRKPSDAQRREGAPANPPPLECNEFTEFHTIEEELSKVFQERCYPVFDIDPKTEDARFGLTRRIASPFSHLCAGAEQQPLKDGTLAVRMGQGRFRVCRTWSELFSQTDLTLKVFVGYALPEANTATAQYSADPRDWIHVEIKDAEQYLEREGLSLTFHEFQTTRRYGDVEYGMGCITIEG